MEHNPRRRNDVLVPLSLLLTVISLFLGLQQIQDQAVRLERRITTLEVQIHLLLDRSKLDKPQTAR